MSEEKISRRRITKKILNYETSGSFYVRDAFLGAGKYKGEAEEKIRIYI